MKVLFLHSTSVRHTAVSSRDADLYAMEPSITDTPMPEQLARSVSAQPDKHSSSVVA